jgi:oligo-1,6-glucosidase
MRSTDDGLVMATMTHAPSAVEEVTAPEAATRREGTPWWQSAVVYQVYPRSFADSDSDGIGDLRGITSRLEYLATLGVDAIWISPIYVSPQDDNGYDISDYRAIDPIFGTLEDFDLLVTEAHSRGMRIVMDLVVNHTSDEHPWFRESASSVDSPKRDWYHWRPPRVGATAGQRGAEPNNWKSFFSGSAWELDTLSGEYFLHLFSRKQPDLNWENPEVRSAIYEMMRWWLDRGIDGFRMDVINFISKDQRLPDAEVHAGTTYGDGAPFYAPGPRIHEFLREMHQMVFEGRSDRFLTVGEMPGVSIEQAQRFTDPARRELNMIFQFEHVDLDHGPSGKWGRRGIDLPALKASFARWQDGLAERGWSSLYWNNHDQPRVVSRFGDDGRFRELSAKLLATVLHLQRGTPFIFQGEELGMTNADIRSIDDVRDIESLNFFKQAMTEGMDPAEALAAIRAIGRDNARTPMQWSGDAGGGFSDGAPWIRVNPNTARINAQDQVGRHGSVFEWYRTLIELRHRDRLISQGAFEMLAADHPALWAFLRSMDERQLLVLANVSDSELDLRGEIDAVTLSAAEVVLDNYHGLLREDPWRLLPWQVLVLETHISSSGP